MGSGSHSPRASPADLLWGLGHPWAPSVPRPPVCKWGASSEEEAEAEGWHACGQPGSQGRRPDEPRRAVPDPAPRVPRKAQYEERFLREETVSQQVNAIELLRTRPLAPPEARRPQRPLQRRVLLRGRPASRPTVIRGVTYYKAKEPEEENDIEEQRESGRGAPGRGGQGPPRSLTEGAVLRPRELPAETVAPRPALAR